MPKPSALHLLRLDGTRSRDLYGRLLHYTVPYWRTFLVAVAAMVVLGLMEPVLPALLKPLLDGTFVEKDPMWMRLAPFLIILVFGVRGLASFLSNLSLSWVAGKVVLDLRKLMFQKLLALPAHFYDDHASGILISKVTYDVNLLTSAATNVLVVLVRDSLAVAGLLAWMIYLNWRLSLLFFVAVPAIVLVVKLISGRLRQFGRATQASMGDMTHVVEEAILGNQVVKIFGGQRYEAKRFADVANRVRRFNMKAKTLSAANVPTVQLIAAIALGAIIFAAGGPAGSDDVTVGAFVSFFGAMALLFSPLKRLTRVNEQLQKGLAAAESVFQLLDREPELDPGSRSLPRAKGLLEIRNLTFTYSGSKTPALREIDLRIEPGETIALVGSSGSGKSTLIALIPRLYRPEKGEILLDGVDVQDLSLANLRANIALVSQDIVLFNDTVAANIAYGNMRDPSEEAVAAAAKAAHATEFIQALPEGCDTIIGENGVRLSGGQKQRLAIARAFLKDAPVLLLDEATSALDAESEQYVQDALETLRAGRTTIIVAHRLSTIMMADRLVVLDNGCVKEVGTHEELLDLGGLYAKLFRLQFGAWYRPHALNRRA